LIFTTSKQIYICYSTDYIGISTNNFNLPTSSNLPEEG